MKGSKPIAAMRLAIAIAASVGNVPSGLLQAFRGSRRGVARRVHKDNSAIGSVRWGSTPNKYKPHQGKQECARRVRQLMYGQIHNHECADICKA